MSKRAKPLLLDDSFTAKSRKAVRTSERFNVRSADAAANEPLPSRSSLLSISCISTDMI